MSKTTYKMPHPQVVTNRNFQSQLTNAAIAFYSAATKPPACELAFSSRNWTPQAPARKGIRKSFTYATSLQKTSRPSSVKLHKTSWAKILATKTPEHPQPTHLK